MAADWNSADPVALDWAQDGTDVDFGSLSRQLIGYAAERGMTTLFGHEVRDLSKESDGSWTVKIVNRRTGDKRKLNAKFVFVGAGGGALPLLQKSGIAEAKGLGGFPIGGRFLRSGNRELTDAHQAKVYGLPRPGAAQTTAPHLDTRFINGKPWLMFGPFAGWSPKFLKQGHVTDLLRSVKLDNLPSILGVARSRRDLLSFLLGQLLLSESGRMEELREFVPAATDSDWELDIAGQRVQVIRRAKGKGGVLEFGSTILSCCRRDHRGPARCLAGCVNGGVGDARRHGTLFRRAVPVLAAQAQGDGAVTRCQVVRRARAVRRGVVVGQQGVAVGPARRRCTGKGGMNTRRRPRVRIAARDERGPERVGVEA